MYERSDVLYDVMYSGKDYVAEASTLSRLLSAIHPRARTILDVGCGTGRHLELLKGDYRMEGLDLSERLLAINRERNPEVPLHHGDMTDFSLGRTFDVVWCLFAAIGYVTTLEGMRGAVAAMARHVSPGGVLIIEPWLSPESFWDDHVVLNSHERPGLAASWMYVQRREGHVSIYDMHYLVGTPERGVERFIEREEIGLYRREEYEHAIADAGLMPLHAAHGLHGYGMVLGRDRAWTQAEQAAVADLLGRSPRAS